VKIGRFLFAMTLLLAIATPGAAQEPPPAGPPAFAYQSSVLQQVDDAGSKLVRLAEAMPAEKYNARPAEGVRSFAEVMLHVAAANYFFGSMLGTAVPEGVNPRELEKGSKEKPAVLATLKNSFDFASAVVKSVPDDQLGAAMKIFGRDGSKGSLLMLYAVHAHEHLGQAIAYARSNGVAPPWSRSTE
jgi:uncharacterized damage-inducible protein DinB